jgi:hypothetical protein
VIQCYDWQVEQPRVVLAKETKGRIGYYQTCLNMAECKTEVKTTRHIIKLRCVDIQRQKWLAEIVKNFINIWGPKTPLEKRGVHNLLHYDRKKWHSMVPFGNLETKRVGWTEKGQMPPMCSGRANHIYC